MGKKKYESISRIDNSNSRNITWVKRMKGIVKKGIELSVLCDQDVFVFVRDKLRNRVVHFQSDPELRLESLFNNKYDRQFLSNQDYMKVGGEEQDFSLKEVIDEDFLKTFVKTQWPVRM